MGIKFFYKIGNWAYRHHIPFIPLLCKIFIRIFFASVIDCSMKIGKNVHFAYRGINVMMNKKTILGDNVVIGAAVTIGGKSNSKSPIIGDNVYVANGAKVLGPVVVGSNVVIGANAVVVKDVPANSVVGGIPAKFIKVCKDSRDYR